MSGAELILRGLGAAGGFDEFAQGDGGAAGLAVEPSPVTGKERYFAGDDTGTGSGGRDWRGGSKAADVQGRGFAEIEVDLEARDGVEDEDGFGGRGGADSLSYGREIAGGE